MTSAGLSLSALIAVAVTYHFISRDLPGISNLTDYKPSVITSIYSDDNRKIAELSKEQRIVIPISKMPKILIDAFLAAEDSRFFEHPGIDLFGIIRAFYKNIEAGAFVQGGSTITQQVTRSFFLTPEKNLNRKLREAILAYRIDKTFTKEEILFLYLNQIYLGHGTYGVQAAAENYFGKSVEELNLAECTVLAGLPQAPSRYSPFRHPERARERQAYVLNRMLAKNFISEAQATEAMDTKIDIKPRRSRQIEEVAWFTEHVRRYVEEKYGTGMLYNEGLQIFTTVNIEMQKAGNAEIEKGVYALDKRQGYRGPMKRISRGEIESFTRGIEEEMVDTLPEEGKIFRGVVTAVNDSQNNADIKIGKYRAVLRFEGMKWARKPNPKLVRHVSAAKKSSDVVSVGDIIEVRIRRKPEDGEPLDVSLEQTPLVEAALLCIEAETGQVKAMIGGKDFKISQFNRAIQARRQPGSAFKPIVYAAALDKGYTPATMLIDSPIVMQGIARNSTWKPRNYEEEFHGPTLLRDALAKSLNVITIKILRDIGIDYAIGYAKKFGITSPLSRDLSIALGSSAVSLLELVRAYSIFANSGYLVSPVFVTRIIDRNGNLLEENVPPRKKVIERNIAYLMTDLMESVVKEGTGRRVKSLNRPVAAKTGTTNNLMDAWFIGYTPQYITGTWVGFDDEESLGAGETGARAASPIWLGFMKEIHADKPVRVFGMSEGIVFTKIDVETGLLPIPESRKVAFECFKEGTAPTAYSKKLDANFESEEFFKSNM